MKKLLTLIVLLVLFTSCSNNRVETDKQPYKTYELSNTSRIIEVKIDNCTYFIYSAPNKGGIIHKQNCKNH